MNFAVTGVSLRSLRRSACRFRPTGPGRLPDGRSSWSGRNADRPLQSLAGLTPVAGLHSPAGWNPDTTIYLDPRSLVVNRPASLDGAISRQSGPTKGDPMSDGMPVVGVQTHV